MVMKMRFDIYKRGALRWAMLTVVALGAALSSCIKNDIPYPVIELELIEVSGEGFTQKSIDYSTLTVTLELEEATDIQAVNITNATYTSGASLSTNIIGEFDMRNPLYTTLYLYQSYEWMIEAQQTITREFKVTGQIGEETINTTQLTASVDVNKYTVDLNDVEILSLKLAADGVSTYNPTIEDIPSGGFSSVRYVYVTSHGRSERWSLYVNPVEPSVDLEVNAWGNVAWLSATGDTSDPDECGFAYRKAGASEWIYVDPTSASNGLFELQLTGLEATTTYEFQALVGDSTSSEITATTESTPQLLNSDFEGWQQIGNPWYPYGVDQEEFWGTGNKGSTLLSSSSNITLPDYDELPPATTGSISTQMASRAVVGVFAAGNIFTGTFVGIAGTNGIIGMGRPFTQRPLGLRGMAKYSPGTVTHVDENNKMKVGDTDMGVVYIALGTWDAATYGLDSTGELRGTDETPLIIDTRNKSTFFDINSDDVIAYQELILTEDQDWSEFELELEYRDLTDSSGNVIESAHSRVPTHILIVSSSSRYGDYFTGSTSSKMWIDDFELIY